MDMRGSVDCADNRDWDVEQIVDQPPARLVQVQHATRGKLAEAHRVDIVAEYIAFSSEDQHLVFGVVRDVGEAEPKLVMSGAAPFERTAPGMNTRFENAVAAGEPDVLVAVLVGLEPAIQRRHHPASLTGTSCRERAAPCACVSGAARK